MIDLSQRKQFTVTTGGVPLGELIEQLGPCLDPRARQLLEQDTSAPTQERGEVRFVVLRAREFVPRASYHIYGLLQRITDGGNGSLVEWSRCNLNSHVVQLCHTGDVLHLRLLYKDQPEREVIRMGMKLMVNPKALHGPCVFSLERKFPLFKEMISIQVETRNSPVYPNNGIMFRLLKS